MLSKSRAGQSAPGLLGLQTTMNPLANRRVQDALAGLGQITLLARDALSSLVRFRVTWHDFLFQLYSIGVKSQIGGAHHRGVHGHGAGGANVFPVSQGQDGHGDAGGGGRLNVRRAGPVLTALMVAGRVGAAMAAEIGTMRVTEQIDALRTLATHPVDYLVVPRIVGGAHCAAVADHRVHLHRHRRELLCLRATPRN